MKKQTLIFFVFNFVLSNVIAQSKIWGTYCETGVSPYTSRNVFYVDGQYFAVLGLKDNINDTVNLNHDKNDYSIVNGRWKYTKNKKMIQISMYDSNSIVNIKENEATNSDSVVIDCKDLFETKVKDFVIFVKLNDTLVLKLRSDTNNSNLKLPKNSIITFYNKGELFQIEAVTNMTIQYLLPSILIPFVQYQTSFNQQVWKTSYTVFKGQLKPSGKYILYECDFDKNKIKTNRPGINVNLK